MPRLDHAAPEQAEPGRAVHYFAPPGRSRPNRIRPQSSIQRVESQMARRRTSVDGFSAEQLDSHQPEAVGMEFPRFRGHLSAWPVWAGQEDGVHAKAEGVPRAVSGRVPS